MRDGTALYVRRHEPNPSRAEIVIVHGFGEHSGRYSAITEHLTRHGFTVTAYDHRGHGQSDGLPGHVDRFADYEADLAAIIAMVRSRSKDRLFLVAHSMGGLIALRYLVQAGPEAAGAVISAPLLGFAVDVPPFKAVIAKISARLAPKLRMKNEIDPMVLSRDTEICAAYAADPLVNRLVSARWFVEAQNAMRELEESAGRIWTPLLVMHGTKDKLASYEATRTVFEKIGSADKELVLYPGFYHELFNEPEKQELYDRTTAWLEARLQ